MTEYDFWEMKSMNSAYSHIGQHSISGCLPALGGQFSFSDRKHISAISVGIASSCYHLFIKPII